MRNLTLSLLAVSALGCNCDGRRTVQFPSSSGSVEVLSNRLDVSASVLCNSNGTHRFVFNGSRDATENQVAWISADIQIEPKLYSDRIEFRFESQGNLLMEHAGVVELALAAKAPDPVVVEATPIEASDPHETPPPPPDSVVVPNLGPAANAVYLLLARKVDLRIERGGGFTLDFAGLRNDLVEDDGSFPTDAEIWLRASGVAGLTCIEEPPEGGVAHERFLPEDILSVPECATVLSPLLGH